MKKILLLSAVLAGAASISQAHASSIRFGFGLGLPLPLPPLPGIVVHQQPQVYQPAPPVCETPEPVYVAPPAPVCETPAQVVIEQPRVYFGFDSHRREYRDHRCYVNDRWHHDYGREHKSGRNHHR